MSLPAMSLGLRFCMSRKGGTEGGGWVHPKGANSMDVSGLALERLYKAREIVSYHQSILPYYNPSIKKIVLCKFGVI